MEQGVTDGESFRAECGDLKWNEETHSYGGSPNTTLRSLTEPPTLRLRSVRPLLRIDTTQVRGGGQHGDGTSTRASNNLEMTSLVGIYWQRFSRG